MVQRLEEQPEHRGPQEFLEEQHEEAPDVLEKSKEVAEVDDELLRVVSDGDVEKVKKLLSSANYDVNELIVIHEESYADLRLIDRAAENGHLEIIRILISYGADQQLVDTAGFNALIYAVIGGHIEVVDYLLAQGADINFVVKDRSPHNLIGGKTPLFYAVIHDNLEMVKLLVERGASLNQQDEFGDTASMTGATYNRSTVVDYLLNIGANTSLKNQNGETVFDMANPDYDKYNEMLRVFKKYK
nr:ankyrin repeat domain-containing protein [Aquibacillus halophilus]